MDEQNRFFLTALRYLLDKAGYGGQKKCATYVGVSTVHFNNCLRERYAKIFSAKLQKKVAKYYSYTLPDFLELGSRLTENIENPEYGIEEVIDTSLPPRELLQRLLHKNERINTNELTLSAIVDMAPVGIGVAKDRQFTWVNGACAEIFGYSVEELTGMPATTLYHCVQDYVDFGYEIYPAIGRGEVAVVEPDMKAKDGSLVSVRLYSCLLDRSDATAGALFIVMDITQEKTLQNQLRQSELLSGTGSFTRNLLTGEAYWSDGYRKLLGHSATVKANFERVVEATHPAYRKDFIAAIAGYIKDPYCESATFENIFINQTTGANQHIKIIIKVLRALDTGKPHTLIGSVTDITHSRQIEIRHSHNEQAMLYVLDRVDNAICIHDEKYMLDYQNDQHMEMYGNCLGKMCYEVFWDRDEPCEECLYEKAVRSGKPESKIYLKYGEEFEVMMFPLVNERGKHARIIEIIKRVKG